MKIKRKWVTMNIFNKIWMSYLITIFIPTVLISSFYFYNYSVETKDEYKRAASVELLGLSSQVSAMFSNFNNLTLQLSLLSNLNELLANPYNASMYDFNVLKNNLIDQITASRMVQSAYVYFKLSDKVLTSNEGFYPRGEFYDKEWIDQAGKDDGELSYKVRKVLARFDLPQNEVISFKQKIPLTGKYELGYMFINVSKDQFFEALQHMLPTSSSYLFIIDGDNQGEVLFSSRGAPLSQYVSRYIADNGIKEKEEPLIASLGGEKYFLSSKKSPMSSWTLVQATPYRIYQETMNQKFTAIGKMSLIVMLLGFLLSYLLALMFYSPWKKIWKSYASSLIPPMLSTKEDEYTLIRRGIDHLINENQKVKATMEQHESLIRHRLIYEILSNNVTDADFISSQLQQVGIDLIYPNFGVCIVDPDLHDYVQTEEDTKIKLYMFGLIENMFPKDCRVYGTILEEGRFGFILNFPWTSIEQEWKEVLIQACKAISDSLYVQFQIHLQFAFGEVCASLDDLHESYAQARKAMRYKALFNKSDVVFIGDTAPEPRFDYPLAIQKMLVHGIKTMDDKKTNEAVTALFEQYVYNDKGVHEHTQETIVILLSTVINELLQEGCDPESLRVIQVMRVHDCRNKQQLEQLIRQWLKELMERLEQKQDKKNDNLYIRKAITYMEQRYGEPISISDIADHVGLSSSYLSRIFKAETQHSPLDYLTKHRITRSKELLMNDKKYSLQEISGMIGYADVHSFIRFFKKYEAMTPGEFRKSLPDKR
ncbi:helix-turn-helix domain-containing protein [Paenibacillus sp. UNC451MF]|uniref:helix-turn-helix domain-containing protein n=1 Tax=Paenibacillus sp. UNC451MF TaxID=1449063 RepID=UPI00048A84EA|nr:helix-turn-helix domain-containing protein [Paenibacillus sp. UNC451MF]